MALETRAQVKELSKVERELSIVVPGDQVAKELDKAYRKLSQKVRLKGFRPGKVPRYVLEQYYKDQTEQDVLEKIVGESYREAIQSEGLTPVAPPDIKAGAELVPGMDYAYSARVEVKPEIELQKFKGLDLKVHKRTIGDDDVQKEIEFLRERYVTVKPVEDRKTMQQGDLVELRASAEIDGEIIKGLGGIPVVHVGSGDYFAEAEQALVGKSIGEMVEVDVEVPEDHKVADARGKTAKLKMNPQQLKQRIVPELNDDFAQDVADEYETLDDLKKALRTNLEAQIEMAERNGKREAALDQLIEANPFEVPASLIDSQAEQIAAESLQRVPPEQAERIWAAQRTRLMEDARPRAMRQVRAGLLLEAIVNAESIEVDEEDIESHLKKLAEEAGQPYKTVKNLYKKGARRDDLRERLKSEKALELVLENATIEEVSGSGD
jgi:trigger factor